MGFNRLQHGQEKGTALLGVYIFHLSMDLVLPTPHTLKNIAKKIAAAASLHPLNLALKVYLGSKFR